MKILVIGLSHNWGGIEAFIYEYYKNMSSDTLQFDFLVFNNKCACEEKFCLNGSRVYFIYSSHFKEMKKYNAEIEEFFSEHDGEYDCIWNNTCDLVNMGVLKVAKKHGISKRIVHSHNNQILDHGRKTFFYNAMHKHYKRYVEKYATDFWACSDLAGKFFYGKNIMNSPKYKVINNGIDVEKYAFSQENRMETRRKLSLDDYIVVGNIGRLNSQKNQMFAIDIVKELVKLNFRYHMIFVGQGDDEEMLKQKTELLGLKDNITFLGARDDIANLLNAMDIFLFPSIFEGLGIALLEAQAAGLLSYTSLDVVPRDVKVTDLVDFISLEKTAAQWADIINKADPTKERSAYADILKNTHFNINNEIDKVKELLTN